MRALILIPALAAPAFLAGCGGPDMSNAPAPAAAASPPAATQKWEPAPISNGAAPPPPAYSRLLKGAPPQ